MSHRTTTRSLQRLRRAAEEVQQAEIARNRLIRQMRAERATLKDLSAASSMSIGSVHRLTRPSVVVSAGYEGRDAETFLDALAKLEVGTLVDVRENAISRKRGFSKTALGEGCDAAGFRYLHERTLGNPKSNREGFRAGKESSRLAYRAHLETVGAEAIQRVRGLLKSQTVAVMCFEAAPHECHRTMVIDHLADSDPLLEVREA